MARRKNDALRRNREQVQAHSKRKEDAVAQRALVIIACEGEKTERLYFESWFQRLINKRMVSARSCVIAPHGHTNPTGVLLDLQGYFHDGLRYADFEHRWIVIDRDEERPGGGGHSLQDFNAALQKSRQNSPKVSVAWSNPSFELWYLLHFRYQNTGTDRDLILTQLSTALGKPYRKSDPGMFDVLIDKLPTALRHAQLLYTDAKTRSLTADQSNPGTTVFQLVSLLASLENPSSSPTRPV